MIKQFLTGLAVTAMTLLPMTAQSAPTESDVQVTGCAIDNIDEFRAALQNQQIILPNLNAQTLGLIQAGDRIRLNYTWNLDTSSLSEAGYDLSNLGNCTGAFRVSVRGQVSISEGPIRWLSYASGTGANLEDLSRLASPNTWSINLELPEGFDGMQSIDQTITINLRVEVTQLTEGYNDAPRQIN